LSIEISFVTGETRKKDHWNVENLAGTGLFGGHNLLSLIRIGLTNLLKPVLMLSYVPESLPIKKLL
jgi:hypothetical protein